MLLLYLLLFFSVLLMKANWITVFVFLFISFFLMYLVHKSCLLIDYANKWCLSLKEPRNRLNEATCQSKLLWIYPLLIWQIIIL